MKQIDAEKIAFLRKKLKRQKYVSILLALFTLGVNIFAWFAFSANASLTLDGTVASWDVEFKDNGVISRNIYIEVSKMKPGMANFTKTIDIETESDVTSQFSYEFVSFSILGVSVDLTNKSNVETYLRDFYPFSITTLASKYTLTNNDSITFDVNVVWPYDSATPKYFGQDEVYSYNDTFIYYTPSGNSYVNANIASSSAYASQKSSLYLEKDDADSFFGMECKAYEANTGEPCLKLQMRLLVEQLLN